MSKFYQISEYDLCAITEWATNLQCFCEHASDDEGKPCGNFKDMQNTIKKVVDKLDPKFWKLVLDGDVSTFDWTERSTK